MDGEAAGSAFLLVSPLPVAFSSSSASSCCCSGSAAADADLFSSAASSVLSFVLGRRRPVRASQVPAAIVESNSTSVTLEARSLIHAVGVRCAASR